MARNVIPQKLKKELGSEAARLFANCGQIALNGAAFNDKGEFTTTLGETKYLYSQEAERILEEIRTLNVIMETLQIGNQYDPEHLAGKCPKLIIDAKLEGFHVGVTWW